VDFPLNKKSFGCLTSSAVLDSLDKGLNVIAINEELNIVGYDKISSLSQTELSLYSRRKKCCIFFVYGGAEIVIIAKGLVKAELNALAPATNPTVHKKYARNVHNYILSIIDHYQNRIRYGSYSDHWKDKQARILRNTPQKTEKIFHGNLQNWLDENIEGGAVQGGVKKVSGDETDIEIRVHGESKFYIIEVKWLGYNGHSRHSEPRLESAITQVKEYLKREPQAFEACLVVYDGRQLEEFNTLEAINLQPEQWKEIRKCRSEVLPDRGKGYVFFLENKSASEKR
jgi:hypothetical protein